MRKIPPTGRLKIINPPAPRAAHNRLDLPEAEIIRLYRAGKSELAISRQFKCSRGAITNMFLRRGIKRRGRSDAMYERMRQTSKSERLA